jgi:hypothetical protein
MAHYEIKFPERTFFDSRGGSKFTITTGVRITEVGTGYSSDVVLLEPLNSKGTATESIRVVVAASELGRIIEALTEIQRKNDSFHGDLTDMLRLGEHPTHTMEAWKASVANGDCMLGYWEWAASMAKHQPV